MMIDSTSPWHCQSYTRFVDELLPRLLAERLPLTGYRVQPVGEHTIQVVLMLSGHTELLFDLPLPDDRGVFSFGAGEIIVIPIAANEELDTAEVRCVGEQLLDFISARLGEAPGHLSWDSALAHAWLPLDTWVHEYLSPYVGDERARWSAGQWLDRTNWLATATHLRRIIIQNPQRLFTTGQIGRACPYEIPEGPNLGRVYTIASGAAIRDQRIVITDPRPEATLGLSASMVPLIEHNEYARQLMGVNMMRQWLPPPHPEPALVQSGNEPALPDFWCGRNLLTAYLTWDADAFEDGIVISESCAQRLGYPTIAEPGDKLSNRHGTKGVISRILPDAAMPHLADGRPIELIYSFTGLPSRLNFGQVREALLGRLAHAEGSPVLAAPFAAPSSAELHSRITAAGLPENGMERLTLGRNGPLLEQPSTVGWVYWGKLNHTAASKLRSFTGTQGMQGVVNELEQKSEQWPEWAMAGQQQGELEYYALRAAGAIETIREQYHTRSAAHRDATSLAARLVAGPVAQADPPSPMLAALTERLDAAGIQVTLVDRQLRFTWAAPTGAVLTLARPVAHPWLREHELTCVGATPDLPQYSAFVEANERLAGIQASNAPESLVRRAQAQLEVALAALFDALLKPEQLEFDQQTIFSARAVAAPGGSSLRYDQVGLADEIAWALFGPLAARELGTADALEAVQQREQQAVVALDNVMARSWVLVGRAPSLQPEAFLAFRPLRIADRVVRMPSLACNLLNLDFDGDQVAIFLPVTEAGQREAGERLTVAAHLTRDPGLIAEPRPRMDALLGLAHLSLTPEGLATINQVVGRAVALPDGFMTRWVLGDVMAAAMADAGAVAAMELSEQLSQLGFETAKRLGLSLSPFVGEDWPIRPGPQSDDPRAWEAYVEEMKARYGAYREFTNDLGGLVLSAKSGARGNAALFTWLVGARGAATNVYGKRIALRHNNRDGLTLDELLAITAESRPELVKLNQEWQAVAAALHSRYAPTGYGVLARAMRATNPGLIFALAAQMGEVDVLHDIDSRLFVGLPPASI